MGLVDKPAFTAGELDPELWERTNLDKYRNGLAAARNWIISKTGSILTRQSRKFAWPTKLLNRSCLGYSPPGGGVMLEWGHLYVRIYSLTTLAVLFDIAHPFLESDLPSIHFETSGSFCYIFLGGKNVLKLNYATGVFVAQGSIFLIPPMATSGTITGVGTPAGYPCQYAVTWVVNGEETQPFFIAGSVNIPNATGQTVNVKSAPGALSPGITGFGYDWSEMRVYRRPFNATDTQGGGAFGYIGSSTSFSHSVHGPVTFGFFVDVGGDADYTHQPPTAVLSNVFDANNNPVTPDPGTLLSNTGIVYQQRLLITDFVTDLQAIYSSQPGFQDNFYRNFPLDGASSLKFKCGTSGYARVLRMLDSDGLVAFTSAGIYLNQGDLVPSNLSMVKKGKWIINPSLPPLPVPGGVIFLDASTNGVRNLLWSFQLNAFDAEEVSIYSNHLFRSRQLNSWCFQQGAFPLLWSAFSDGAYAGFTFDYNQQMQAWTRHDGILPVKYCAGTTNADQTFFIVSKIDPNSGDTIRYFEYTIPRYVSPIDVAQDHDFDKNSSVAYMDGMVSTTNRVAPIGTTPFVFAPTVFDPANDNDPDWSQPLNVTCGGLGLFTGLVVVGAILRFFDEDKSEIDVKVLSVTDANNIQVQINNIDLFPSNWATGATLYVTMTSISGLSMFEQEYPAVVADGAVLCSPNNDQENYPKLQVVNGVLTFPAGFHAAIVHVGRPIVGDVMTLDIDTVEQQPTLIESLVVNKIYVKVKDSKGLYVGANFPSDNGVSGMVQLDSIPIDYTQDHPIIGNRAQPAQTKRFEVVPNGDYRQQGKIAVRQVDPLHAEILSFIPDVEIQRRSDR